MSNFAYAALAKIVEGFTLFSLLNHALPQSLDQGDTYVRVFFADFSLGWTIKFWFKSCSS